jgi:hypothetical protein
MADEHPKIRLRKDTNPSLAPFVVIIALIILAVILWFLPRPSAIKAAQQAPQTGPANADVRLDVNQFQPAPAPTGDAQNVTVEGTLYNVGSSNISGVNVQGIFRDASGKVVLQQEENAQALTQGHKASETETATFADQPLGPGANEGFRAVFTEVPPTWNKQKPEVTVLGVQMASPPQSGRPNPAEKKR